MEATEQQRRQHQRLETLADVIYGVVIVLLVAEMPTPRSEGLDVATFSEFLAQTYELMIGNVFGLVLIVTYWLQSNALNGILSHTNNRHSALVVAQLIVMLFYFYAIGLAVDLDHPTSLLMIQSGSLALMGVIGMAALHYSAGKGRLLEDGTSESDVAALRTSLIPEPLTALITLPVAIFGIDAWSLAWLGYPLVAFVVNRIAGAGASKQP